MSTDSTSIDHNEAVVGEERSWPRIATTFPALFSDENGYFIEDIVTNVSRGGLFLKTTQPLNLGCRTEMILMLPDAPEEIAIQGEVRHSVQVGPLEERGMGIMFTTIEPILKKYLGNYLHRLEEKTEIGRRAAKRIPTPRFFLRLVKSETEPQQVILSNISRSGMLIETSSPLSLFENIATVLQNPESQFSLELQGEVVHVQQIAMTPDRFRAGVRFLHLSEESEKSVLQLIREIVFQNQLGMLSKN